MSVESEYLRVNLAALGEHHPSEASQLQTCLANLPASHACLTPAEQTDVEQAGHPERALTPEQRFCLLLGIGDASIFKAVVALPAVREVLLFEPYLPRLIAALQHVDLSQELASGKVFLVLGEAASLYQGVLDAKIRLKAERVYSSGNHAMIAAPETASAAYQVPIQQFLTAFHAVLKSFESQAYVYLNEDNFRGLMNSVRNVSTFQKFAALDDFVDAFKSKPGIIVGSGPSLARSLPYLKKVQNQAVIFACDSALKPLLKAGIVPHFVGCLERVSATRRLFEELPADLPSMLVAPPIIHPDTIKTFPGPKLAIFRDLGFDQWLFSRRTRHDLGRTVGQLCLRALVQLGCRDISFIGVDCAYDPATGASHDRAVPDFILAYGEWEKNENDTIAKLTVPGNDGKPKQTMDIWHADTILFGDIIAATGVTAHNVIPVEYGIPIPRTARLDPEDLSELMAGQHITTAWCALQKRQAQALVPKFDIVTWLQQSRDFLDWSSEYCLQQAQSIMEIWHEYDPCIAEHHTLYASVFPDLERKQLTLMQHPSDGFSTILVPLMQDFFLHNGYLLNKCYAHYQDKSLRYNKMIFLFLDWFLGIHGMCDRVSNFLTHEIQYLINQEKSVAHD